MDVSNSSAIVTGGASGLGEACARRLTAAGAKCVILDMNEDKGKAVAAGVNLARDLVNEPGGSLTPVAFAPCAPA